MSPPRVDDARRAGVDELADAVLPARGDDVLGAGDVGGEEVGVPAPDAGLRGDVEDDVAPRDGPLDGREVGEVAERLLDAELVEPRVRRAGERADGVAARRSSRTTAPPRNPPPPVTRAFMSLRPPGLPGSSLPSCLSAQTASFSRKIFELCRTSTGNEPG